MQAPALVCEPLVHSQPRGKKGLRAVPCFFKPFQACLRGLPSSPETSVIPRGQHVVSSTKGLLHSGLAIVLLSSTAELLSERR